MASAWYLGQAGFTGNPEHNRCSAAVFGDGSFDIVSTPPLYIGIEVHLTLSLNVQRSVRHNSSQDHCFYSVLSEATIFNVRHRVRHWQFPPFSSLSLHRVTCSFPANPFSLLPFPSCYFIIIRVNAAATKNTR